MLDSAINNTMPINQTHKFDNIKSDNLKNDDLKKVCDDFETFFTQQLLDVSLKSTSVAGEGTGSDIIKGMYTENISKNTGGNFGISNMLYQFLSKKS